MLNKPNTITVDNLTATIRGALLAHPTLTNFVVTGELRELKKHSSGHVYFTLLGENSRVSCAIFKGYASRILLWPKEGEQVAVKGKLDLYAPRGEYKVIGEVMIPIGLGAKSRLRAALGKKLEAEGLFDPRVKRSLPSWPNRVAVITSPTGAALQDVLKLHSLRFPKAELIIVPSLMQGLDAKEPILKAFRAVAHLPLLDAVMFVRGGGSRDDLDIFDEEEVVRAVRSCPVPVITGLGHEIDRTFCDDAADFASPTPSGAAERLFPDREEIKKYLLSRQNTMENTMKQRIFLLKNTLISLNTACREAILHRQLAKKKMYLALIGERSLNAVKRKLSEKKLILQNYAKRLESSSPLKILSRGYAITEKDGHAIASVTDLAKGDVLQITYSDGQAKAKVEEIKTNN
ncbi:MAG: exodeoxyribonuclease VII large subunit [Synergistaceae bacterium]|nr:exodeoxyribonuclease VII large subunit [Synergistaceae bacterium]